MIRIFNHYLHKQTLLQVFFDLGLIVFAVIAVVLSQGEAAQTVLPFAASHGLSLAGCMFVINSATGFYQHVHNRSVTESCARALFGLLFGLPLAYAIFSLVPSNTSHRDLLTLVAMAAVAAVMVHRVYAAHSGTQARMRSRILIFGTGAAARATRCAPPIRMRRSSATTPVPTRTSPRYRAPRSSTRAPT